MKTSMIVVGLASVALANDALAQITMTTGTTTVAGSWSGGNPGAGYEDPNLVWSDGRTLNYSGDGGVATFANFPFAIANGLYLFTQASWGGRLDLQTNFRGAFSDSRDRAFTWNYSTVQNFTLTSDYTFERYFSTVGGTDPLMGPLDNAVLENLDGGSPITNLLSTSTGFLPAGNYQIRTSINASWITNQQTFDSAAGFFLNIGIVPAPGVASVMLAGGLLARRRRR